MNLGGRIRTDNLCQRARKLRHDLNIGQLDDHVGADVDAPFGW